MSSYDEQLNALRAARAERDKARDDLHRQRLNQLKLLRSQSKADRKEVDTDQVTLKKIAALTEQISELSDQTRATQSKARQIELLEADLANSKKLLSSLTGDLDTSQEALAEIEAQLNNPNLTPEQKTKLEAERAALLARINLLKQRIAALKAQVAELENKVHAVQGEKAQLEEQLKELSTKTRQLQEQLDQLAKAAPSHSDHAGELEEGRQQIKNQRTIFAGREKNVGLLIGNLFANLTPQKLIEQWNDSTPIMLLPLRLETRFKEVNQEEQLWVRVFPDEIAIATHEKILTERESEQGVAYWKALSGTTDEGVRKDAWRTLSDRFGANRAAWVALQTKPSNWNTPPPPADDLVFPDIELTKPDSWSEAPHSVVMPDRFVLMAYRGGQVVHTLVGKQIDDRLVLGPAPLEDESKPSITRNKVDQRLEYGEDLAWLGNFQLAVDKGMGFRVSLNAQDSQLGFDQLLVIGLKLSADEKDGQKLIEDLIHNHHYSADGFSLVRQGSATNNTDGEDAHFSSSDWLHDVSYFVETGEPLFTWQPDPTRARDGQRLAEYLGISFEPLQYISNSDATDNSEAVAMNRALYAGTLGYFLNSMLNDVMSDETIQTLRELFTDYVTGRGPIPTIRVGNQPYGILLTSAFTKWAYPQSVLVNASSFDEKVRRVLLHLHGEWRKFRPQLGHITNADDARASLMKVLGLQPTSADFYHRVGYSYDSVRDIAQFISEYYLDVLRMLEQTSGRKFLRDFGYNPLRADGRTPKPVPLLFQLIYQHYHTRLDNRNIVDNLPLSEERGVKPYDEGSGKNYITWLLENSADINKLEKQDFGGAPRPNALLYMMLHNALLLEAKHGIWYLFASHNIVADELVRSRKFMNISSQPDVSHWEVFRAPAHRIVPAEVSQEPLLSYIQLPKFKTGANAHIGRGINQSKEALKTLAGLPTARLERLFVEHIDTLNYRLDAWQTALFDRRLREQRQLGTQNAEDRRTGIYVGSYGYLENVRAQREKRARVPDDALPPELREGIENLSVNPKNGGYVHTPSLNHATAAAILRNGYLTHATPAEREKLTVNLSSERVRRAKYLIEGVRNGQTLEALLGYLFERGMHDLTTRSSNPIILDQLKPIFRKAFPINKTKIPRRGFASEPAEVIPEYSVVNGLSVAKAPANFPTGVAGLPALSADQSQALNQEKKNLENSLDALRDVLTAECAYQLALGNFDRAAAVMQSISGGVLPVEIEVINSARGTDLSFTNRVAVQFDSSVTANPWPPIALSRRARTEPAFNNWVGTLLGDPTAIRCSVKAIGPNGAPLPFQDVVSLADLGVQPLDFIYLIRKKVEATGYAEIEARVRYHFARKFKLGDTTVVKIEFANSGGGAPAVRSFAEILPFANAIRELAGRSRPLNAQDFVTASKTTAKPSDNPGNIDVTELQARVAGIRSDFDILFADLITAVIDADLLQSELAVDALRQQLVQIADAGLTHAFPLSTIGFTDAERESLLSQSRSLQGRYEELKTAYDAKLTAVNAAATKPPQKVALLTEMAKGLLGDEFVLLPRFSFSDPVEVVKADAARDQLLVYVRDTKLPVEERMPLPVAEWLQGVSLVRPNLHTFNTVLMLSQTFNFEAPDCSPLQLPFRDQDSWLGVEFPEGTEIVHDTIAMVQCLPQGFQPTAAQAGLLIDEWTETLPQKREVTGITFNYDQPNSAPPSAILLAIPPRITGKWHWDDLTEIVLETMERAKLRAVEPDMIETLSGFGTLLPSTMSEFSTGKSGVSLDYLLNLAFIDVLVTQIEASHV